MIQINPTLLDTPAPAASVVDDNAGAVANQIKDVQRGHVNSTIGQMVGNSDESNAGLEAILAAILALPSN